MDLDPYHELGVAREADERTIKNAFRQRVKKAHPDAGGTEEALIRASTALAVLTDPARRKTYDDTGRIEEDKPDIDGAAAFGIVQQHMSAIVGQFVASGFDPRQDPRRLDVVEEMRRRIQGELDQARRLVPIGEQAVAYLKDMASRFTLKQAAPDGFDPIARGFSDQVKENEQKLRDLQQAIRQGELALKIATGYAFKADPPPDRPDWDYGFPQPDDFGRQYRR